VGVRLADLGDADGNPYELGVKCDDSATATQIVAVGYVPNNVARDARFETVLGTAGADEYGVVFVPPAPMRLVGVRWTGRMGGDTDIVLYDSGGAALQTLSLDASIQTSSGATPHSVRLADYDLTAGATYRVTVKPTTTTDVRLGYYDLRSAANSQQAVGAAASTWQLTKRLNGGAWTDVDTQLPTMVLLIGAIDDGASTGGGFEAVAIFGG
jgi:hypothetical protein